MTETQAAEQPVSEVVSDTGSMPASPEPQQAQETTAPSRQVPLEALEAERRKRQELERQNVVLQDYALRYQQLAEQTSKPKQADVDEAAPDDDDLVNKKDLRALKKSLRQELTGEEFVQLKRDISEDTFKRANPEAIRQINTHLKEILERKPWLTQSIESADNRYERAWEIVQDFAAKPSPATSSAAQQVTLDAKKIVENAKKPGSPVAAAKSPNLSNVDYLHSIAGTKEFVDYRRKLLGK